MSLVNFKDKNKSLFQTKKRIVLAYSGGLDSSVLLHLLIQYFPANQLLIWHINHQLQDSADNMESFCKQQVEAYQLNFRSSQLALKGIDKNIESVAREARYNVFSSQLDPQRDLLLTAHHADDQVETLMLNIFRGSGVLGLRGIGSEVALNELVCLRPLLAFTRKQLLNYAKENKVKWIDDLSNNDEHFDRNFIRHNITPQFEKRWPSYSQSFLDVASHQVEAAACLKELAEIDYKEISGQSVFTQFRVLKVDKLNQLSIVRQKNLLKHWLLIADIQVTKNQLNRSIELIKTKSNDHKIIELNGAFLTVFKSELFCNLYRDKKTEHQIGDWISAQKGSFIYRFNAKDKGVSTHFMKRLFQKKGVPPWLRDQIVFEVDENNSKQINKMIVL